MNAKTHQSPAKLLLLALLFELASLIVPQTFSAWSGRPGEAAASEATRADKVVTITITEPARVNRVDEYVSFGVPLPRVRLGSPMEAQELIDTGGRLMSYMAGMLVIKENYEEMQRQFERVGFAFDNRLKRPDK